MKKLSFLLLTLLLSISLNAQEFSAGVNHTLVLCDNDIWSTGRNLDGQLGIGNNIDPWNFSLINIPSSSVPEKIDASDYVSSSMVLMANGEVWSFGNNFYGQLGLNNYTSYNNPQQILGPQGNGFLSNIKDISCSAKSLAVENSGLVLQWGQIYSQLPSVVVSNPIPQYVYINGNTLLTDISKVSSGKETAYALDLNGRVWSWGLGNTGSLGNGNLNPNTSPFAQMVQGGLTNVIDIKAGQTMCLVLKSDGTVWAWGFNGFGQLGDGTNNSSALPVQVRNPNNSGFLTDVVKIEVSGGACFAIKSDGTLWSWGYNGTSGVLGNPIVPTNTSTTHTTLPIQVVGKDGIGFLQGVTSISSGDNHAIATFEERCDVAGWGYNNYNPMGVINQFPTANTPRQLNLNNVFCCNPLGTGFIEEVQVSRSTICQYECVDFRATGVVGNPNVYWQFPGSSNTSSASGLEVLNICYDIPGNYVVPVFVNNSTIPSFYEQITVLPGNHKKCNFETNPSMNRSYAETEDMDKVKVYPNPSKSLFNIELPFVVSNNLSYIVKDIQGRTILKGNNITDRSFKIDLESYTNGLYYLTVITKKGNYKVSLIKN